MNTYNVNSVIRERYTLKEFLRAGELGEVWLAQDDLTKHYVILKIFKSLDQQTLEEFQVEYSNILSLTNNHLLSPTHFDVFEQRPFIEVV